MNLINVALAETASKTVDTGSSRFTMLVAPSGYIVAVSQHIK
jgi:hypothetical protein